MDMFDGFSDLCEDIEVSANDPYVRALPHTFLLVQRLKFIEDKRFACFE